MTTLPLETLILAVINGISIFLIIIVLANSFKEKLYRWFVAMTILLMGWVDFAYLGYIESDANLSTLSYKLNLAFVAAFFFAAYIFYIECFLKIKNSILKWSLLSLSSLFVILSLFTNTIIDGVISRDWGNEINFGSIYPAFSVFALVMSIIFIYYFISRYITAPANEKNKIKLFLIGTFLFIAFNIIFNILTTTFLNTAEYQHYGDYSAIVFLLFTTIAIVSRQFLNIKVALAAFVISAMSILLLIDIITVVPQGTKIIIFIFFVGLCAILMRSVLNEIKQREELAKINIELDKSRQRYIDLATEQKDIIDVMGHEIRTPLSIIKQELNYHKEVTIPKQGDWEKGKVSEKEVSGLFSSIHTIDEEVDHTLSLVTDMLETARIDKERFELNLSNFDIIALSKKAFETMAKVDAASKFKFKFEKESIDSLIINADETRIRESIDALLNNALKYGVNIEGKESIIEMSISNTSNEVSISVSDNGRGIDPQDIEKLGKKFVRLDPRTKNLERPGGTGLGLFVVTNIMRYHGGKLEIKSEGIGKGSSFILHIPIKKTL